MNEQDDRRRTRELDNELKRQLEAIRSEEAPDRLLTLARELQDLLRKKRDE